eukprot:CAMPEP_0201572084 /NCGR_PEP_ID=MMETSP0190_2-20130828/15145_1 /ASSEMBLY_ACC=CAM_ASM_000263 /TAXON_ID=37353 /ORGANISM="Rosalina sp." /LENGTH=157 /DNA_ID=CAMNT_0047997399 /DNA_START=26 /DNA_END=499 /DNA_ORIENTATION=+
MADFGDRWRVFFIAVILSVWLVIIDGLNFCFNFDEDQDSEDWAKILVLISGFIFAVPVLIGAFLLLIWVKPKVGALMVIISCIIAGGMRLLATLIGFKDFWQETYLDSTTSGTTDVAIAALQVYLIFDSFYLYRQVGKVTADNNYQPVDLTDRDDEV